MVIVTNTSNRGHWNPCFPYKKKSLIILFTFKFWPQSFQQIKVSYHFYFGGLGYGVGTLPHTWQLQRKQRRLHSLTYILTRVDTEADSQSKAHLLPLPFPTHIFPVSGQYSHTGCVVIFLRKEFSPPLFFGLILFLFLIYAILLYFMYPKLL